MKEKVRNQVIVLINCEIASERKILKNSLDYEERGWCETRIKEMEELRKEIIAEC